MMMKWGLQRQSSQPMAPDANVFDEYQAVFGAPMSVSKRKAIRTRFPA
jgi:hypothetical protein